MGKTDYNSGKIDLKLDAGSDKLLNSDDDFSAYKLPNHKTSVGAAQKADYSTSFDFGNNFKPKHPRFGSESRPKQSVTTKFSISHPPPSASPKFQIDDSGDDEEEDDEPKYTPKYRPKKISEYKSQGSLKKPQLISFDESDFEDYKPSAFSGSPVDDSSLDDSYKSKYNSFGGGQNSFSSPADYDSSKPYDSDEFDSQSFGNIGSGKFGQQQSSGPKFNFESFNSKPKFPTKTQPFSPKFNFDSSSSSKYNFDSPSFDFDSSNKYKTDNPKFASDFELKNIKLPQKFNSQKYDPFSVSNPNPLDFKPQFKLQDVPNLYPQESAGYGVAGRGQIESFYVAEQAAKDELIKQQLKNNPDPATKGQYQQFLKAKEDEQIEQQQFREQLQLQQQQQQQQLSFKNQRPNLSGVSSKFRPVRRIPARPVSLGLRHYGTGVPSLIDRPYSITFKV